MTSSGASAPAIGELLCDMVTAFHEREPFVGGLFNAYEKAVHYGLVTEALRRELWGTDQEVTLSGAQKCDVLLRRHSGGNVWVEVKQWWFLYSPYRFWTQASYKQEVVSDWDKLRGILPGGDQRAVMLVRAWDETTAAKQDADAWLQDVAAVLGPAEHISRDLRCYEYSEQPARLCFGDVHVWHS